MSSRKGSSAPPSKARKVETSGGSKRIPSVRTTGKLNSWVTSSFDGFGDDSSVPGGTATSSSQEVNKTGSRSKKKTIIIKDDLWVDKHAPGSKTDLAVHKKKVEEVENWIQSALHSKHGVCMLLLTGPSGAGKTATVRVLAKELGCEVMEWFNPTTVNSYRPRNNSYIDDDFDFVRSDVRTESQETLFRDFLLRANKYPTLVQVDPGKDLHKKILLIEDFPNVFMKQSETFHHIMRRYKATGRYPLVVIISDNPTGDSNERLLFPKILQSELDITNIGVNPVAPTSMVKVLGKIASFESSQNPDLFESPAKEELESLSSASAGDIRGAINALTFACLKHHTASDVRWSQDKPKKAAMKKQKSSRSKKSKSSQKAAVGATVSIGGKDSSLILFRALGKVLYCKREEDEGTDQPALPAHLQHHTRLPLLETPEEVVERSHMSGDLFTAFLHQNYLDFYTSLEDTVSATAYLSDSDALTVDWASRSVLQEYSTCVATRGLMFCNSQRSRAVGFRPLHKPEWYTVVKKTRTNQANIAEVFRAYRCTAEELMTEYIPYLHINITTLHDQDQIALVQEMGRFSTNKIRRHAERLTEEDVAVTESLDPEDSTILSPQRATGQTDDIPSSQQNIQNQLPIDEDFIIEDFDD